MSYENLKDAIKRLKCAVPCQELGHGSFPEWVGNFCEVLRSDQLSSEERSAVTKAIHDLFKTDANMGISGDFLMKNISLKYGSRQNPIDAFQGELCDAMRENYPPVLRKIFGYISGNKWLESLEKRLRETYLDIETPAALIELAVKNRDILTEDELGILSIFWQPEDPFAYPALIAYSEKKENLRRASNEAKQQKHYDPFQHPVDGVGWSVLLEQRFPQAR